MTDQTEGLTPPAKSLYNLISMPEEKNENQILIQDLKDKFSWTLVFRYVIAALGITLIYFGLKTGSYIPLSLHLVFFLILYNAAAHLIWGLVKRYALWQIIALSAAFQSLDIIAITFLIYITGWIESPYWFLYLVVIILSGFGMFSYYSAAVFIVAFFSAALYFGLLLSAYLRILPIYGADFTLSPQELLLSIYNKAVFSGVVFFLFAATVYYFSKLLNEQRHTLSQKNQELADALQKVENTNRLKDDFISTASHELRRPLSVVRENMALIRDGILGRADPKEKEVLTISLLHIDRIAKKLDNLLDIAKIQSHSFKLHKQNADLSEIAGRALATLDRAIKERNIGIITNLPDKTESQIDPELITAVFVNLIENAVNNTPVNGKILAAIEDNPAEIKVIISDNGIGIPEHESHKIFERFMHINENNETSVKGAGLGLSICKGIVEMHGGRIWFESPPQSSAPEIGKGTKFIFTLPKADQNEQ